MLSFRKLICANLYRLTSHLIINRRYLSFRAHHYYQLYTYMGTISYSLVKVLLLWLTWASWTVLFIRCRIMYVFSSFVDLCGNNFLEHYNESRYTPFCAFFLFLFLSTSMLNLRHIHRVHHRALHLRGEGGRGEERHRAGGGLGRRLWQAVARPGRPPDLCRVPPQGVQPREHLLLVRLRALPGAGGGRRALEARTGHC